MWSAFLQQQQKKSVHSWSESKRAWSHEISLSCLDRCSQRHASWTKARFSSLSSLHWILWMLWLVLLFSCRDKVFHTLLRANTSQLSSCPWMSTIKWILCSIWDTFEKHNKDIFPGNMNNFQLGCFWNWSFTNHLLF